MIQVETTTKLSSQKAIEITQEFIANHLTDLMGAGVPWRMSSPLGSVWVVPIWIAYPGYERPITIGSVAIDEVTGMLISWTPFHEIFANAEQFHSQYRGEIEKGFLTIPK